MRIALEDAEMLYSDDEDDVVPVILEKPDEQRALRAPPCPRGW